PPRPAPPPTQERLDSNSGILSPLYDPSLSLLLLFTRGSNSVLAYEYTSATSTLHPIGRFSQGEEGTVSCCLVPKAALDVMEVEVDRTARMTDKGIEGIGWKVPRRDKSKFAAEVFKDVPKWVESCTGEEWLEGKTVTVEMTSLDPSSSSSSSSSEVKGEEEDSKPPPPSPSPTASPSSRPSSQRFNNMASKFRHVYGAAKPKQNWYYNLQTNVSVMDGSLLAVGGGLWAAPWKGGGGKVYVGAVGEEGKVSATPDLLNTGHTKAVTCLAFGGGDGRTLATGSDDCNVSLSELEPRTGKSMGEPLILRGHRNGVRGIDWHPTVNGCFATFGMDQSVKIWDAGEGKEIQSVDEVHKEYINDVSWNYVGSLLATGSRDKLARIIDPRAGSVAGSWKAHDGARGCRVEWCGRPADREGVILTTGNGVAGERQVRLWDPRNVSKPVAAKNLDNGNGVLFSMWDECTGLVWVAGRGDRTVRYFDVNYDDVKPGEWDCTLCHEFGFEGDPTVGIWPLPRSTWKVGEVQVGGFLRLSKGECQEGSFFLPRNNDLKGYFQDDVYSSFRDPSRNSSVTPTSWLAGEDPEIEHVSLDDGSLPKLSERVVTRTVRSKTKAFREEIDKAEEEEKQKNQMFEKMQAMAVTHEKWHPNKSMGGGLGGGTKPQDTAPKKAHVDCQPIYDSSDDDGWSDSD
ncbi:hypothetical protein TrRE_jg5507, partial [Triparma retinervis]